MTCQDCDHVQYKYHSCRNRHCPSCQGSKREEWINRQQQYLLDVPYYHVVFTIPDLLNPLCLHKPRSLYNILFKASWETISTLSKDSKFLGAQTGMTAVLHTWGSNLSLHPHLHCIVPGGGVIRSGKWKTTRSKGNYLFPAKVMAVVFRAIFIRELKQLVKLGEVFLDKTTIEKLYRKKWGVYAKRPFAKPAHVIEYLGRYTHKVAISNYRLSNVSDTRVSFSWKDYRQGGVKKEMTLAISEFLRRLALHILPHRFVRIRHYGILSFHGRSNIIPHLQKQQEFIPELSPIAMVSRPHHSICPICNGYNITQTEIPKSKGRAP